jgi:hypothetical protein
MDKKTIKSKLFVTLILGGIAILVVAMIYAPQPVNWSFSFSARHDLPYGTKLVYKVSESLFPDHKMIVSHSRMTDFLKETTPVRTNFIYINNEFKPDSLEVKKMLQVARAGNSVFIAAEDISNMLADSLKIKIERLVPFTQILMSDSIGFNFTNRTLKSGYHYWYKKGVTDNYFSSYDTLQTTVLGHNHLGKTNYIRIKQGDGAIFFNCNPLVYTNYHLLSGDNSAYIFKSLSYLPVATTVWDEHYKIGASVITSEMRFILSNPALSMAWYLLLSGVLIFFIFRGKRYQSAIPVIAPPENQSLSFLETVSSLYFVRQDHKGIAHKRFVYFKEYIRTRYFVDITAPEKRVIEETARKSGVSERTVASLFKVAGNLEKVSQISQEDLQQFNRQIEFFYKTCQ